MKKIRTYLYNAALLLIIAGFAFFMPEKVHAQAVNSVVGISYKQNPNKLILKYSPIQDGARFKFEFAAGTQIPYKIKSNDTSTTITFFKLFSIETQNLTAFSQYKLITQKKISERGLEITFPLPLASSFEHLNDIILDLHLSSLKGGAPKNQTVTPLQISSLSFSWNTPVALSVFKRDKYLWIVFNQYQLVKTNELLKDAGSIVKDIIQLPHASATILRLEAADEIYSEVRKEGLLWIVDLYNKKTDRQAHLIPVILDTSIPKKPYLQVNLPHTEDIFSFLDPEVGDMLAAITSSEAGHAFWDGYKYPDFSFLPTSQGMAVNSDDFNIGIIRNTAGFMLQTTMHPLNVSQNLESLKQMAETVSAQNGVNISQDLTVPIIRKTFAQSEKFLDIQTKISLKEDKNKFYLELVRFYLSHALGTNALNKLRIIENSYTEQNKDIPIRIKSLKAVAQFIAGRRQQAFEIFNLPELRNNPEVKLWRALSNTDADVDECAEIVKSLHFIHNYPIEVRRKLIISGMEYALSKQNDDLAQRFLNLMREQPADDELNIMMNYFEAEKVRAQGYFRMALPKYKIVAATTSNKYSALARYRIADFNSQVSKAKLFRTIQELERLKFAWGEKKFKIQLLNKLAEFYIKTNNFYMAMKTLQELQNLSGKNKDLVEQRMIQTMEEIYYYNSDSLFSPIKALALFDDFGYLIKRSQYQTAIMIKLTDRLVAVDLLDRAYNMLETYMNKNKDTLSHREISAMGSRLALINLFKDDGSSALLNLEQTHYDDIPQTLALQRRIIQAQALIKQGRTDYALELIGNDTSKNAILLKSEIYWNAGQWNEASEAIRMLIEKPQKDTPLSDEQIRYILDWVTALKQAGKETVIVRIRNTFMPYFEKTPYYSIFSLLTGVLENDKIDIKDINKTVKDVQAFSNFTKQYNQSLIEANLAEDNAKEQAANR